MKIRHVEFAMVPAWVIEHPTLQGQYTRLAVYVGLRYVGFKYPDRDWRSDSRLAETVAAALGCPANTVRNHLMQLREDGLVVLEGTVISFPDVENQPVQLPGSGQPCPVAGNSADDTSIPKKKPLESSRASALEIAVEDPFASFWAAYPRKVGKPEALKAWRAIKPAARASAVMAGLASWVAYWTARGEPEFVPHPATWVRQRRWEDDPPPVSPGRRPRQDVVKAADAMEFDEHGGLVGP